MAREGRLYDQFPHPVPPAGGRWGLEDTSASPSPCTSASCSGSAAATSTRWRSAGKRGSGALGLDSRLISPLYLSPTALRELRERADTLAAVVSRLERRLDQLDPEGRSSPWGQPGPGDFGGTCLRCACGCRDKDLEDEDKDKDLEDAPMDTPPRPWGLEERDWGEGGPSTAAVAHGGANPE